MKWRKKKIDANDGKKIDCWISDCKSYMIIQNINDGVPHGNWKGKLDKYGHRWIFEIIKVNNKGEESSLGTMKTLKDAKLIAEDDGGY